MPNKEIKDYINQQLSRGATKEQISAFLVQSGWAQKDIDLAFANASSSIILPPPPPPPSSSTIKKSLDTQNSPTMWDAFEHIILFISLYVMATAAGLTLHYLIDKLFPPTILNDTYSVYSSLRSSALNWYLASLIVATPIFSVVFLDIQKRTSKNPQIRNIKVRKVFIYITLVITFLIMISKVILSVYNLLSGNVSMNSLLHLLVNITIPGMIFGYYAYQIKGDREIND